MAPWKHILAAGVLLLVSLPAASQTVRGDLTESATGRPVAGVFVVLLDGAGKQVAGGFTDASGGFTVQAPAPGSYTLRAERVGHAAVRTEAIRLAVGETRTHDLEVGSEAVQLEGLVVQAEKRRCAALPEAGVQTAALWEEARKALSATVWTQSRRPFRFTLLEHARMLDASSLRVQSEQSRRQTGFAGSPFVSVPAERLAREGFTRQEGDSTVYYAPDAAVLLSDEFLDTHCFRVQEGEGPTRGMAGLAFEPVRGRRLPDVRGVLWLDPATAELRHLEYTYTGLNLLGPTGRLGGRVEFERLPSGEWIVPRWRILMPVVGTDTLSVAGQVRERRKVAAIREGAGEVLEVRTSGGVLVRSAARAALSGTVFDSTRAAPLAGARVRLAGTAAEALTDAQGRFRIADVAEGRYAVVLAHPRVDSLEWTPPPLTVDLRSGAENEARLAVPPLASVLAARCSALERRGGTGVVVGAVREEGAGVPPPGTPVVLTWAAAGPAPAGRTVAWTDAMGNYHACAVPFGVPVEARVGSLASAPVELRASGERAMRHDLAFAPPRAAGASSAPAAAPRGVRLAGRVVDAATRRPVAGATVLVDSAGAARTTGARGEFAVDSLPPGSYRVRIAHADYGVRFQPVEIRGAGAAEVELPLERREVALEPLVVTAASPLGRRTRASGVRMDVVLRDDIEQYRGIAFHAGDLLRRIPGVSVEELQVGRTTGMLSGVCVRQTRKKEGSRCAAVVIDDLPQPDGAEALARLRIHEVESVEFVPPVVAMSRFGGRAEGGALVIYTVGNGPYAKRPGS